MDQGTPVDVTGQGLAEGAKVDAPKPAQEDSLAPKFAALAKKEKWIRQMDADVKRQKEELKKKGDEYERNYVSKSKIKENFLEVALDAGLTPDQIATILLNQQGGSHIDPSVLELKNELKALKDELLQTKTGWQDSKTQEYNQALNQIKSDATKMVDTNPEFETIKAKGLVDKVVEYIETTYKEDGVLLSTEDACREVEETLVEDTLATFNNVKKLQERLKALQAPVEPQKPRVELQQQQSPKTLTNGMNPSSKPRRTEKDRVARAKLLAAGIDPDSVSA